MTNQTCHWLARLVGHPTVSTAPNMPLIAELETALTDAGAVCTRIADTAGQKASLAARLGPDLPGGLMLSGHVDVVPAEGQAWTVPPFQMTERGDLLYGRGTADMKGFVACMAALAERFGGHVLSRPLWLAISYDEEVGCIGVRPMLDDFVKRDIRPDLVVVGEPTSMRRGMGHKGKIAFSVRATGAPRHSSEAPLALNALHLAAEFVTAMRQLQDEISANGPSEAGYTVPHATVHVGKLQGGTALNLVPDSAELEMELRFLAADDADALADWIRNMAAAIVAPYRANFPYADLTVRETVRYPGLSADSSLPAQQRFSSCLPPDTEECKLSFGTEGGLFSERLQVPVVVCGPGSIEQAHRPDEYISKSQLAACDAMLDACVEKFCIIGGGQ